MRVEAVVGRGKTERRRHPRWVLRGRVAAHFAPQHDGSLINVSAGGALVEHAEVIRPGGLSLLTVLVPELKASLKCKVVRSVVHRYEVGPTGERELIYRTGLEFLGSLRPIPEATR